MGIERDDYTTSELRHDWLADRWVIIAPQRSERPDDFIRRMPEVQDAAACPFCKGKEHETPPAVQTYPHAQNPADWHVRVIPNKFPAVNGHPINGGSVASISGEDLVESSVAATDFSGDASDASSINLFRRRDFSGGHEVIVESPAHVQSLSQLDRSSVGLVFSAYRDRLRCWLKERQLAYAVVFKNVGVDAGASLAHTHSQLIATDVIPTDICRVADRMREFHRRESTCLFCRMVEDELEHEIRVVEQTPDFVAFCPFASRLPSQVMVLPKKHACQFEDLSDFEAEQLSWLTHRLVRRIERCFPDAAYNFVIHTAPDCMRDHDAFHWRMELFPRLTKVAGFEWGSDCYINPLAPEEAAANLRRAGV